MIHTAEQVYLLWPIATLALGLSLIFFTIWYVQRSVVSDLRAENRELRDRFMARNYGDYVAGQPDEPKPAAYDGMTLFTDETGYIEDWQPVSDVDS